MKLLIRQRVFSWTDSYDVYDEPGNVRYTVSAEFLAFGHQIHVYDAAGREVGAVRQKLFRFLPQFELEIGGRPAGLVRKEFTFFRPSYAIDCCGWSVQGDFFGWDYDVNGVMGPVAHISKEPFHWGDTYVLDIFHPEDELACLMLAIAIDAANCSDRD